MMRQSLSLLLVVMTALALSACGQDADGSPATVNRTYKLADAASSSSAVRTVLRATRRPPGPVLCSTTPTPPAATLSAGS